MTIRKKERSLQKQVEKKNKYLTATQWQLMWWKFKKHRLAVIGTVILCFYLFMMIFAEFLAPYSVNSRRVDFALTPPQKIHFIDSDNNFYYAGFVYDYEIERNPITLRQEFKEDQTKLSKINFFVKGDKYKLFGLIPCDVHLFGIDKGFMNIFGTDDLGRDLLSRTIFATRTSLSIGVVGVITSFILGLLIGGVSGYFGGWIDFITQRAIEFIRSIPTLPLWMALSAAVPKEWAPTTVYFIITIILSFLGWTNLARRVRGKLLSLREEDFVEAARLAGSKDSRIIQKHLLPSFLSYIIVDISVSFPYMIIGETSLSFVGLGLRPPVVSWGTLLQASQNIRSIAMYPWLFIPAIFVIIIILAFSFVGDGIRDAADPYNG